VFRIRENLILNSGWAKQTIQILQIKKLKNLLDYLIMQENPEGQKRSGFGSASLLVSEGCV
jgi:hypothetical protein